MIDNDQAMPTPDQSNAAFNANPIKANPVIDHPFEFEGKGGEYFRIWIVNILFTIVTLGIYSAWATVRTRRYFYANLKLAGEGFEYHAEPMQILKGRIIALIAFALYSVSTALSPLIGGIAALLLILVIPLFILLSLRFSRRMTSYRNIRFSFQGSWKEAYLSILVWPLLSILTLGILFPLAQVKFKRFVVNNSRYGTENFAFAGTYADYGKLLLLLIAIYVVTIVLLALCLAVGAAALGTSVAIILLYGGIFYIQAMYMNLTYRRTTLREHSFESTYTGLGFAWILISNILLIVVTLGIFLPFAKVRFTKYLAENVTLKMKGSLDDFTAGEAEKVSALGQEVGTAFDFDLGIGI